jgi:deoxyribose-phosphate aldolase
MKLTTADIARMIDLSAVRAEDNDEYIESLVACANKYRCIAVYPLPSRVPLVRELLGPNTELIIGGAVGFPSGGQTTAAKIFETKELISMGCMEIDMVINISKLRSDRYDEVRADIRAVVEAAAGMPVKVILECHYLTDAQILRACDEAMAAKVDWVKTGTGWAPSGATLKNIALIKGHVGDAVGVKAAGGIRDLNTLLEMYKLGARRFGLGLKSSTKILEEAFALSVGFVEV